MSLTRGVDRPKSLAALVKLFCSSTATKVLVSARLAPRMGCPIIRYDDGKAHSDYSILLQAPVWSRFVEPGTIGLLGFRSMPAQGGDEAFTCDAESPDSARSCRSANNRSPPKVQVPVGLQLAVLARLGRLSLGPPADLPSRLLRVEGAGWRSPSRGSCLGECYRVESRVLVRLSGVVCNAVSHQGARPAPLHVVIMSLQKAARLNVTRHM
jgi:hypothetical protein